MLYVVFCLCCAEKLILSSTAAIVPTLLVNSDTGKKLLSSVFVSIITVCRCVWFCLNVKKTGLSVSEGFCKKRNLENQLNRPVSNSCVSVSKFIQPRIWARSRASLMLVCVRVSAVMLVWLTFAVKGNILIYGVADVLACALSSDDEELTRLQESLSSDLLSAPVPSNVPSPALMPSTHRPLSSLIRFDSLASIQGVYSVPFCCR